MRKRDRIIALIIAIAFFATSFALSFLVIWDIIGSKEQKVQFDDASDKLQQPKLQGTKLTNFTPVAKVTSLQIADIKKGTGKEVKAGDSVTVDYTGALAADGTIFQSSLDAGQPVSFSLSGVIKGWQEGIPGMKEGGTRRLIIPASLAYGATPPQGTGIPANAALVFDVTLHSVGE